MQIIFSGNLRHAELNSVFTAVQQPLKGIRALKFNKIICVLLDVFAIDQTAGEL